jgi:hypothetical protein
MYCVLSLLDNICSLTGCVYIRTKLVTWTIALGGVKQIVLVPPEPVHLGSAASILEAVGCGYPYVLAQSWCIGLRYARISTIHGLYVSKTIECFRKMARKSNAETLSLLPLR